MHWPSVLMLLLSTSGVRAHALYKRNVGNATSGYTVSFPTTLKNSTRSFALPGQEHPPPGFNINAQVMPQDLFQEKVPGMMAIVRCAFVLAGRGWNEDINILHCSSQPTVGIWIRPAQPPHMQTKHDLWSLQLFYAWWVGDTERISVSETTKYDGELVCMAYPTDKLGADVQRPQLPSSSDKQTDDTTTTGIPVIDDTVSNSKNVSTSPGESEDINLEVWGYGTLERISEPADFYSLIIDALVLIGQTSKEKVIPDNSLYDQRLDLTLAWEGLSDGAAGQPIFTAGIVIKAFWELAVYMGDEHTPLRGCNFEAFIKRNDEAFYGRLVLFKGKVEPKVRPAVVPEAQQLRVGAQGQVQAYRG